MSESKYSPEEEDQKHKAEEARKVRRQAQWENDPEEFFHVSEIIFGAIKVGDGAIGVLCGADNPRAVVEAAICRMQYKAFIMFQNMDMQAMMKQAQEKKIITAPDSDKTIVT